MTDNFDALVGLMEGMADGSDSNDNNNNNDGDGGEDGDNGDENMLLEDFGEADEVTGEAADGEESDDSGELDWTYPKNKKYQHYIVSFFNHKDRTTYPKNQEFTKEQMLSIRPNHVRRWLRYRAYHKSKPGPDDKPIYARSGSLQKAKSGLSYYHPHKHAPWIDGRGGNPTLHSCLTAVIREVEKAEVRGQGVPSNEKRPYTDEEYEKLIELLKKENSFDINTLSLTLTIFAKHLIHRVDDTCNFKMDAPFGNVEHDFTIKTRTRWSKNCTSFRNCPPQIMFGSKQWDDCILLHLANYLEQWCASQGDDNVYLFARENDPDAPERLKRYYKSKLEKVVWDNEEFKALYDQVGAALDRMGLGGHSLRKYAATYARNKGSNDRQVDFRGRWVGEKGTRISSKKYISVNDEHTDAFVAGCLCVGGPIAYELSPDYTDSVTEDWLFQNVVPNIYRRYRNDRRFCRVMALALLWGSFDAEAREGLKIDIRIRNRFINECVTSTVIGMAPDNYQPVRKLGVVVNTLNGKLVISKHRPRQQAPNQGQNNNNNNNVLAVNQAVNVEWETSNNPNVPNDLLMQATHYNQQLAMISNMELRMVQQHDHMMAWLREYQTHTNARFDAVLSAFRSYGGTIQGAFQRQLTEQIAGRDITAAERRQQVLRATGVMTGPVDRRATLSRSPRDLVQLWMEWSVGIDGRKPAKDFTSRERNQTLEGIKQKYYRRKMVWRVQARLLNGGMTLIEANSKIHSVTGGKTVTQVIDRLIAFQRVYGQGRTHPDLANGV